MSNKVKLKNYIQIQNGYAFKSKSFQNSGIPIVRITNVENGNLNLKKVVYYSEDKKLDKFLIKKNDILLSLTGDDKTLKICINDFDNKIYLNQRVAILRSADLLDQKYLYYSIKKYSKEILEKAKGIAQKNISTDDINSLEIPLPSSQKQKQIAKILDKVNELIELRKESITKLDELSKSIFIDMFIDNIENIDWKIKEIKDLALDQKGSMRTGPFGSDLLHSEFVTNGEVSVLGIDNAVDNTFKWKERRFITKKKYEKLKRYTIYPNDVIITIMGTVGRTCVIPQDIPLAINTKHLAAITFDQKYVNSFFISYSLRENPMILNQIKNKTRGALMDGLNLTLIKSLSLSLPPLELQNKFAKIIEKIEEQKILYTQELEKLQENFDALLQKSFQE